MYYNFGNGVKHSKVLTILLYFLPKPEPLKHMKVKSKKRMQPEEAMKILKQEGMEVTLEQAQLILAFLYKFAKISLAVLVENPKNEWHRQFDSYRAIIEEMDFQID